MKHYCLIISLLFLTACQPQQSIYSKLNGFTMGTSYSVTLKIETANKTIDTSRLKQAIEQRLAVINQLMSTYIDESELSRFNQTQSTECLALSDETLSVINAAQLVFKQSHGKFDVTLAPLIELWGFDKKETNDAIPDDAQIQLLLNQIGSDKFTVADDCVKKQHTALSINLSAIAKGYAVDQIAHVVSQSGSSDYLVEIGGEVANQGVNPQGKPWRIAIESASSQQRSIQRVLTPKGYGVATSGDYRNYFEKDGERYSHTIDPTTGKPIKHNLASVTVLHNQTMFADAYATAVMVMGDKEALVFAEEQQFPIFMLVKHEQGFKEVYNDAFKQFIEER
jgi:FAD:protein FMN transferase